MNDTRSSVTTQTETAPLIKTFDGSGRNIILAMTGTSGAIYGLRMLRALLINEFHVDLIMSDFAQFTLYKECNIDIKTSNVMGLFSDVPTHKVSVTIHSNLDLKSSIFTNEFKSSGMIVSPCAMGTLAGIANGSARNLIEKSADFAFSYKAPLILVPRETPINKIHLQNMERVIDNGGMIVPAMPSFEYAPKDFNDLADFIAGRVLDLLCAHDRPLA
jgi:4-hydroxy-3-polyprenylbenzoate decarboxylase